MIELMNQLKHKQDILDYHMVVKSELEESFHAKILYALEKQYESEVPRKTAVLKEAKLDLLNTRFTKTIGKTNNENLEFEFPTKAQREDFIKNGTENVYLAGFENIKDGKGSYFNFILSNGLKSAQTP